MLFVLREELVERKARYFPSVVTLLVAGSFPGGWGYLWRDVIFLRGRWGDALAPGQRLLGLQEEEGRLRNVHHKSTPSYCQAENSEGGGAPSCTGQEEVLV